MAGLVSAWAMARRRSYLKDTGMRAWRLPGQWSDGGLSEEYGHGGPFVCLGDGQTEAAGVPSQGGRGVYVPIANLVIWKIAVKPR